MSQLVTAYYDKLSAVIATTGTNFVNDKKYNVGRIREIPLDEVSWHDHIKDCWIVIYDRVYNITDFFEKHPGGNDVLLEHAGRDATAAFSGTGHSLHAVNILQEYLIGELPMNERIFRKSGGLRIHGMPE